ncbi:IclR family transcriptional regulator [Bordetella bronchiseptica]|nr:helix-turn-helix domain-containing protein [Bordetella bronchiseptica]KDC11429.1 IclR helix-turn-helix domain protein [Bordetella bronchiseptica E013]SHS62149.1 regulatory proteins IclR [Mycobacteroides abscessus subsp. abscessus]SUV60693.1 Solvent efflux pump srpABC operon corepressor [Bordetella bronchiseptica]
MTATMKGAQAVSRALSLLRHISHGHPHGIGIAELAIAAQLDRTTAYRLASSLVEFGLVERDPARNYRLGVEAMQLGLAAMRSAPVVERLRPIMRRLARRTEDTVFLVVRNGDYGHCLHSEEGSYPVKALVLQVGGMRVLGIGSAGSTLLANLPDDEIAALYQRHQDEFDPRGGWCSRRAAEATPIPPTSWPTASAAWACASSSPAAARRRSAWRPYAAACRPNARPGSRN